MSEKLSASHLQSIYENVYKDGKENFFSRFKQGQDISETNKMVWSSANFSGKFVLDIGCGTGEVASGISDLGALSVVGIDYAQSAINEANLRHCKENLRFEMKAFSDWTEDVDIIVSCGTIEHMERPDLEIQRMIKLVNGEGLIILTCPYFINVRGLIWMTLAILLDVPMSLTDKHFIAHFDIEEWLQGSPMKIIKSESFDYQRANGEEMLIDMKKRLTNALRDAELPNKNVDKMIDWLGKLVKNGDQINLSNFGGSNSIYVIGPR